MNNRFDRNVEKILKAAGDPVGLSPQGRHRFREAAFAWSARRRQSAAKPWWAVSWRFASVSGLVLAGGLVLIVPMQEERPHLTSGERGGNMAGHMSTADQSVAKSQMKKVSGRMDESHQNEKLQAMPTREGEESERKATLQGFPLPFRRPLKDELTRIKALGFEWDSEGLRVFAGAESAPRQGLVPPSRFLVVAYVHPSSAAASAQFMAGDAILSVGGAPIRTLAQFLQAIARCPPGSMVRCIVRRAQDMPSRELILTIPPHTSSGKDERGDGNP